MKKYLLTFGLFFSGLFLANAQYQNDFNYSLGVKTLGYEQFPSVFNQDGDSNNLYLTKFNGLIFKVNDNQISFRFLGGYYRDKDFSFNNDCDGCELANGNLEDLYLKIGFEKNIIFGCIQPYFGIDFGFKRTSFEGRVKNLIINNPNLDYEANSEKNGGTLSPLLGVKLNIISNLTLAAEANFDVLYSYEKQEKVFLDAVRSRTTNNYRRWEFLPQPLGQLSLQFNFGSL